MRHAILLCTALALSGCGDLHPGARTPGATLYRPGLLSPPDAPPGTCWDKSETPAVIESQTRQILVTPAKVSETGTVQAPPVYKTQSTPVIVQERQTSWYEIVCPNELTTEFTASLQRALALRGYFLGTTGGIINAETHAAIKAFQEGENIPAANPSILTVEGAQKLGLRAVVLQTGG